jgi:hypothetical protein
VEKLRVLIMSEGRVVDIQELDDPRLRYIDDFNQLNKSTSFTAVLQPFEANLAGHRSHRLHPRKRPCRPQRHCRSG